jgi:hypothetical protein
VKIVFHVEAKKKVDLEINAREAEVRGTCEARRV